MSYSMIRRVTPAVDAACLVLGALTLAPPTAVAESPSAAFVARPDSLPDPDAKPEKKRKVYTTCEEARAAHAGPIYRGLPQYNPMLDRDGDGYACNE
ncbi:excalibur calcium-binding domain-containing protein [Nocardia tenerifensis]|uniref:excalibur calcium-binding domain-containing protein n=1 Tax=Nocardia tenerifensis TaxID=228006 RepID=UPI001FEAB505|nr:excalibur calcium-binding domain-containing protein [Nocardia tenerifensis]